MTTPVPIIERQRRLVEVGRLRMGEKKISPKSGKAYPAKRKTWRLTSRDKARLDAAALIYGGTVTEWEDQWELGTDSDVLDIAVVPGQALSVTYEEWGQQRPKRRGDTEPNPVICLRRCDGRTEMLSGNACPCALQEDMVCLPTTRLSVVLRKVPGLGVWRVDSKGWNSFYEIQGSIELLESLVASRRPVSARLRLDQRTTTTATGTKNFVVPVVDIDHAMDEILHALGEGVPVALPSNGDGRELEAGPQFSPVPNDELPPGPQPSVRDQALAEPAPKPARKNASAPIAATGLKPRPAADPFTGLPGAELVGGGGTVRTVSAASTPDVIVSDGGGAQSPGGPPAADTHDGPGTPGPGAPDSSPPDGDSGALPLAQSIAMWARDAGFTTDEQRHTFLRAWSSGKISSSAEVTPDQVGSLRAALVEVKRGTKHVVLGEFDVPVLRPTSGAGSRPPARGDAYDWSELTAGIKGVGPATCLRRARAIAEESNAPVPAALEEIAPAIAEQVVAWLEDQR